MIKYDGKVYRELRCPYCGALLLEEYIYSGRLRVKCNRCKRIVTVNYRSPKRIVLGTADS